MDEKPGKEEAPSGPTPEAAPQAEAEDRPHVETSALILTCISLLASKAWEAMGLIPDPATKRIERTLPDAQLAIDAASALVELIREKLSDSDRRELDTLLMNLRLNFVEQKGKQ